MSKIVLHLPKRIQSPKRMKRNETDRIAMKEKKMNVFTHMEVRQLQKIKPDENFNAILKWKLYLSQRIKKIAQFFFPSFRSPLFASHEFKLFITSYIFLSYFRVDSIKEFQVHMICNFIEHESTESELKRKEKRNKSTTNNYKNV